MPISYTHQETKDRIISIIKSKGPSLPVQIAKAMNISPLFASAFLSELYGEGRLLITHMRVGSSPLYLIASQEANLEKFVQYLNQKERESFLLLQRSKLLNDEQLHPVIRVAIRGIKDFAIPIKIKQGEETKLFWKYFLIQDSEIKSILEPAAAQQQLPAQPQMQAPVELPKAMQIPIEQPLAVQIPIPQKIDEQEIPKAIEKTPEMQAEQSTLKQSEEKIKKTTKKKSAGDEEETKFQTYVKEYLKSKDIEIIELLSDKKKEFTAKVRTDTLFGKQEYFLTAKDKKKISETDLAAALEQAKSQNMPAVFMSPGELDKKGKEYAKIWKNLVKTERLNL